MNFRDKKEEIRNWIKNNVKGEDYILIGKDKIVLTGFLDSGRVEHAEINKDLKFQIILDTKEPITIGVIIIPVINGSILNATCNMSGKINKYANLFFLNC